MFLRAACVLIIFCSAAAAAAVDWPALVQKPYEQLKPSGPKLKPLLVADDGQAIATPTDWDPPRERLKKEWLLRLGSPPPKPAKLDIRVEASAELPDHVRRLVSFQSEGNDRIQAYLLVPRGAKQQAPLPAVVVFHETTPDTFRQPIGLGSDQNLAIALHLVQRGYVTLSPQCYIMKGGGPLAQSKVLAKRRPGWTGLGKMTFDASRSVDYLETVPEVDKSRIGCMGHSLGAKEVLYAMAFEPRYKAGVFSEGGIGLAMSNWCDPWYLTAAMKPHMSEMDNHEVLGLVAPRPLLVIGGNSADTDASWSYIREARSVYQLLAAKNRIGFHNHRRGHSLPSEARDLAYRWLDDWLGPAETGELATDEHR